MGVSLHAGRPRANLAARRSIHPASQLRGQNRRLYLGLTGTVNMSLLADHKVDRVKKNLSKDRSSVIPLQAHTHVYNMTRK